MWVRYSMVTTVNNTVMHKRVNLESSQHKKNTSLLCRVTMVTRLWWSFCSVYKYWIICCTPETNIICQLYLSKRISVSICWLLRTYWVWQRCVTWGKWGPHGSLTCTASCRRCLHVGLPDLQACAFPRPPCVFTEHHQQGHVGRNSIVQKWRL